MQKTISLFILLACCLVTFTACDNELNVAAEWEEVVIVYGALNPTQAKNYVRIQRAYLDEKQAAVNFSQIKDSLYFDSLDVRIEEYSNGNYTNTFVLTKVNGNDIGMPKDSGIFYSDQNILYELNNPVRESFSAIDYSYKIIIRNPKTGHVCTATALSLGKPEVTDPVNELYASVPIKATEGHTILVRFQEGKWVRSYSVVMDYRIEEFKKNNPADKVIKELKWHMITDATTRRIEGFQQATITVPSSSFLYTLAAGLKVDPTLSRRLIDFDIKFYGISDDFNTYLSVNKPSIGIVQKKPEFTNLTNALGLFTSRHIKEFNNKKFNTNTVTEINLSKITKDLGFVP
jgi:hypothetical protein